MDINTKINLAHFNLITETVKNCLVPIPQKADTELVKKHRLMFSENKLLQIWCDCSELFEYEQIKKLIQLYNSQDQSDFFKYLEKIKSRQIIKKEYSTLEILKQKYGTSNFNESIQRTESIQEK